MKMLFLAGREPSYVRNAMMIKCLDELGVDILDCTDSSASYPARYLFVMGKFLSRKKEYFDCVFVGFFGQPLVPLIRLFTDKPIILDAFLSAYDTFCFDRKIFKPGSLAGRFLRWLDRYSCEKSTLVLLDTNEHIDYFSIPSDFRAINSAGCLSGLTSRSSSRARWSARTGSFESSITALFCRSMAPNMSLRPPPVCATSRQSSSGGRPGARAGKDSSVAKREGWTTYGSSTGFLSRLCRRNSQGRLLPGGGTSRISKRQTGHCGQDLPVHRNEKAGDCGGLSGKPRTVLRQTKRFIRQDGRCRLPGPCNSGTEK